MRQGNRPTAELSVKSRATRLAARIASGRYRLVLVAIATAFWPAVAATSSAHANSVSGLSFRLVDLSPLAGDVSSGATDVNDVGHVAGYSSDSTTFRAVLWAAGRVRNLGTLPAPYDAGSVAYSVNDRDEVVGESRDSAGNRHAFLWRQGKMTDLGTLGGPYSSATAINDLGDVVGNSATSRVIGSKHGLPIYAADAFLWHDGHLTDLGSLPGGENSGNIAFDINDLGQIAGVVSDGQASHAATWRNGRWSVLDPLAPGDQMEAIAINDRGQVAGNDATRDIAVLWTGGAPEDVTASGRCPGLGPFDFASDVNDLGWLLASATDPGRPTGFGGFWRNPVICRAGTLQFLPAPPNASDVAPSRMNKLGAIVGTANLLNASGSFAASRALLWSPVSAR